MFRMPSRRVIAFLCFLNLFPLCAQVFQVYSSNQLIPFSSPVYDALITLFNEKGMSTFATNAPLTGGELKFYLELLVEVLKLVL